MMLGRSVVVVVEGEQDLRVELARRLASQGFAVAHPANGREALEVAGASRPTVMLLGPSLPVMDGWQVISALKRNVALKRIPVIVAAARPSLPEGVVNVPKPFDVSDIVAHVRQAVAEPA